MKQRKTNTKKNTEILTMSVEEKTAFRQGMGFGYQKGLNRGFSLGIETQESNKTPSRFPDFPFQKEKREEKQYGKNSKK